MSLGWLSIVFRSWLQRDGDRTIALLAYIRQKLNLPHLECLQIKDLDICMFYSQELCPPQNSSATKFTRHKIHPRFKWRMC